MKKLFLAIAALFLLLIAAALAAPFFISADTLKRPLIEKIQAITGRTLTIDGAFRLSFFPVAGVTMENVSLSNPPGYGDAPPLATLKSLEVGVSLLPLLHRDIQIKKLVLDEPHINLHVDKNGVKNWQMGKPAPASAPAAQATNSAVAIPAPVALPSNLHMSDVVLKGGVVTYADDTGKKSWDIGKLNASIALTSLDAPLSFTGDGEWNHKTVKIKGSVDSPLKLSQMQAAALDAKISGDLLSLNLLGSLSLTDYRGKMEVDSPSLKDLLAWLQPGGKPLSTPAKLALALNGDAQCSKQSCALTNAHFTLDGIKAGGMVKATYGSGKPGLALDLTTGVLDFNPFLPPAGDKHADNAGFLLADALAEPAGGWSDAPIDLSGLQAANVTADIKTDGIVWRKITIGKAPLHAVLQNGRLSFSVTGADMYGGKGDGTIIADGGTAPPSLEAHIDLKAIQAEPLLKDAAATDRISGTANFQLTATAHGGSERDIVSALDGTGSFKLDNGALKGIDLANIPQNLAGGLKLSDNPAQKTAISTMNGSFVIAGGVVSNHDLVMEAALLHMSGQGTINLPARAIDYRLTPQVVRASGQAAKEGLAVPIDITGSLDSPSFRPDLGSVLQNALKDPKKFREQLKNSGGSLKDQLNNPDAAKNLKGLLKGL